jgi:hypothetical protein
LEKALDFHPWPHEYRLRVLTRSPSYRAAAAQCDIEATTFLRVIRDPAERAISSWCASYKLPAVQASINGLGNHYSFDEFLNYLLGPDAIDDVHLRPQLTKTESLLTPSHFINLSREDLYQGLNAFEKALGVSVTDFNAGSPLRTRLDAIASRHHIRRLDTSDDWSQKRLSTGGVKGRWPGHAALLNESTLAKIRQIYAVDYQAFAPHLAIDATA